eukprot:g4344.t1
MLRLRHHVVRTFQSTPVWRPATAFSTTELRPFSTPSASTEDDGPDFNDAQRAYKGIPSFALGRAWVVLKLCTFPSLVNNAELLLSSARRVLGDRFVETFIRPTFFNHFCAGTSEADIRPTVEYLHENGVGSILDYAAEADVDEDEVSHATVHEQEDKKNLGTTDDRRTRAWQSSSEQRKHTTARIYDYTTESSCDMNAEIFKTAIRAVHNVSPEGFAAIKITALGNPVLLERWSSSIVEIRRLFKRFDTSANGVITRAEFESGWREMFVEDAASLQYLNDLFNRLDMTNDDTIDLIEWTSSLQAMDTYLLASMCKTHGSFAQAALQKNEVELVDALLKRVVSLVELAEELDVRLMFDAEHTYFQPAIHSIVLDLQKRFNRGEEALVYNTYQCYLRSASLDLSHHMERSEREGWKFACKLVRGAYMVLERERAEEQGYKSPIHGTIEETHDCYNSAIRAIIERDAVKEGHSKANLVVASHNQDSIELVLDLMKRLSIPRSTGGVYFGQLLGMADHLTFSLGNSGYLAYKYVPYGPFYEVLPYLVRRAQENSSLLGNVSHERRMIKDELLRRLNPFT